MKMLLWVLLGLVVGVVLGGFVATFLVRTKGQTDLRTTQERVKRAAVDAEHEAKETVLAAKEEAHHIRTTAEEETRARQAQVLVLEQGIQQREEVFVRRLDELEQRQGYLNEADAELQRRLVSLTEGEARLQGELEKLAGLSREQARAQLLQSLE